MAEKLSRQHEAHHHSHEHEQSEHLDRLKNKIEKEATEASKAQSQEQAEHAKSVIEKLSTPSERLKSHGEQHPQKNQERRIHGNEQAVSFSRTMTRVRKKLNPIEKPLSKVIHNPVIDKTSEVAGKTIARPSSVLGGAFFSLLGTSALLWITRHYGYEYNYLVVIMMFVIGMVFGVSLEALLKLKSR